MTLPYLDKITCKHGIFDILKQDRYVCKSLIEYGEWCEGEVDLYKDIIQSNDIIIEVGSHIGTHAIPLAKIAKEGFIYCFEPQRLMFDLLKKNVQQNNISNCEINFMAVSNKEMILKIKELEYEKYFQTPNYTVNSGGADFRQLITHKDEGYDIALIKLDNKFKNLQKLDFIKIDAEGNELDVLHGSKELINKFQPIIYFEFEPEQNLVTQEILKFLDPLGYSFYYHITPMFNFNNHKNNKENYFSELKSYMFLCIHNKKINSSLEEKLNKNNAIKNVKN